MRWFWSFFTSSVGAKVIMAVTGVALVAFLIGHMVGNLQVFAGPDKLNAYAEWLHEHVKLLWTVRLGLIAVALVHIYSSLRLTLLNRAARPISYAMHKPVKSTFSSRWMFVTGFLVLAFLIYHLLQFTFVALNPEYAQLVDGLGRKDVYSMVVLGFQNVWVAGSYVIAMVLLGLHLNHAVASMFQTLGVNHPRYNGILHSLGPIAAIVIAVGNITMPVAILLGYVKLPTGGF